MEQWGEGPGGKNVWVIGKWSGLGRSIMRGRSIVGKKGHQWGGLNREGGKQMT